MCKEKGSAEEHGRSSQLDEIIHMLLTDTHLKREERKNRARKILNDVFQLQY